MAYYYISSGQSSRGLGVKDGYMYILSGGTATSATANSGGFLAVCPGGTLITATVNSGGGMYVSNRGDAASTTVNKGGFQSVYSGGSVISTTVNSGGKLSVASGGTAINTVVNSGGMYAVSGTAAGTVVNSGGSMSVSSGGTANYTTLYDGNMSVSNGGKATNTVVSSGGKLYVSGGTVNSTTVNSGGICVIYGGTATIDTQVNFGGGLYVASGGTATEVTVTQGGRLGLTVASNTYVQGSFDGSAFLMKNAYLSGYTVNSGGSLDVASGGTVTNTIVDSGGSMAVSKGKVTGTLYIVNGAKVRMVAGSILDFDISRRTTYSPVLVNNLSLISETPNYTITVSSNQAAGVYSLAGGAAGFGGNFTIGTGTENYGTVTVNGNKLTHGGKTYTLKVAGSSLQLTIGGNSTPTPTPTPAQPIEDLGAISIGKNVKGSLGYNGNIQDNATFTVGTAGTYRLNGNFGKLNASVTISSGTKAVAKGTVKNGALTFNKGNPVMLAPGNYSLVLKNSDKGKSASEYTFAVNAVTLFNKGDNDSQAAPHQIGTVTSAKTLVSNGWVGFGDEFDYYAFTLKNAANLSLNYTSTDGAKFTLCNAAGKKVLTSSVKANVALSTKAKLFEAGTYYLQVQSTNAKKGGNADFTVAVNAGSVFFTKGNNADDSFGSAKNLGTVTAPRALVNDWVGVGDAVDYQTFTLKNAAKLQFTVNSSDAAKFTVYNSAGKSIGNVTVKAGAVNTKDILVDAGTYYLSMQSTKAKKDGNADYSVTLNGNTKIFSRGDNSNDTLQKASVKAAKLKGQVISGWVGYGDAVDFIKFQLDGAGQVKLTLDNATAGELAAKKIKLSCLDANGKSVAIALNKNDPHTLLSKKAVNGGEFYLGVTCANVKKYDSNYSITTGLLAVR